jgi:hypothetical protein
VTALLASELVQVPGGSWKRCAGQPTLRAASTPVLALNDRERCGEHEIIVGASSEHVPSAVEESELRAVADVEQAEPASHRFERESTRDASCQW